MQNQLHVRHSSTYETIRHRSYARSLPKQVMEQHRANWIHSSVWSDWGHMQDVLLVMQSQLFHHPHGSWFRSYEEKFMSVVCDTLSGVQRTGSLDINSKSYRRRTVHSRSFYNTRWHNILLLILHILDIVLKPYLTARLKFMSSCERRGEIHLWGKLVITAYIMNFVGWHIT
jgi:hypothetical protein